MSCPNFITFKGTPLAAGDVLTEQDLFRTSNTFYGVQVGGKVWDYAPLSLIVEEAGGRFGGVGGEGHPVEGTALFSLSDDLHRAALALLP